jgi:hypothetical protein
MKPEGRPQKIIFGGMREQGVRGVLVDCHGRASVIFLATPILHLLASTFA